MGHNKKKMNRDKEYHFPNLSTVSAHEEWTRLHKELSRDIEDHPLTFSWVIHYSSNDILMVKGASRSDYFLVMDHQEQLILVPPLEYPVTLQWIGQQDIMTIPYLYDDIVHRNTILYVKQVTLSGTPDGTPIVKDTLLMDGIYPEQVLSIIYRLGLYTF
jgi:hypothetical protein